MSTIEEQIRDRIAELKTELAKHESALATLTAKSAITFTESATYVAPSSGKIKVIANGAGGGGGYKGMSVNAALLQALASGPLPRKDILPAIEALRPGTTGQTVSSALNGLQKTKKVRLKNGVWSAL